MTELEEKIQKAAQAYYTDGSSELSDAEFDSLVEQLRVENPESSLLQKTGWGYSVESDSTPGTVENAVNAKIYCIDSEEYCTMLLAEEY